MGTLPSAPIRVANVCRVLWNGGVQRAAIAQTEYLRNHGCECDLWFLRSVGEVAYALPSGAQILATGERARSGGLRRLFRLVTGWFAAHRGSDASVDLDLLWEARRLVQGYDVVIYNDQYAGLLGAYARIFRGQPYVLMFHEFYPIESTGPGAKLLRPLAGLVDRLALLMAPAVVTTSSRVAEPIERFVPGRCFLARLGAPRTGPVSPVAERDRRSVFSVTVWDRGRHPEMYLDLARSLPEFRFTLAGIWTDPAHFREFQGRASELPNLEVTGPISEADRESRLAASLLYLRVGYAESGPGMGGLEALAHGSIVIANQGLGLSELLTDGKDGFVCPGTDPAEIAALLRQIDGMPGSALETMSRAAQDLARRNSWEAHGAVLLAAIRRARGPRERADATAAHVRAPSGPGRREGAP